MIETVGVVESETVLAQASADSRALEYLSPKGAVGVGAAVVSFDIKITLTDKSSGISLFWNPEGNLDLPEVARVNTVYAAYRVGDKHHLDPAFRYDARVHFAF